MNPNDQQAPGQDQQQDAQQTAMLGMMGSRKRPRSTSLGAYGRPAPAPPQQQYALQQHNTVDEISRILVERNNWHWNTFGVPLTMIEQIQFIHNACQTAMSGQAPQALGAQFLEEKIAQLETEFEKQKMHNEGEKIKNRVLAELDAEMSSKVKEKEEALEEKQKKIKEGMQLKERMERENQELRRRLGEVERGEEQGEALSPRVQTPPSQAPLDVRSQETQEKIVQLKTEIEKLKTDNEARRGVSRVFGEFHNDMDSKIKKLDETLEEKQKKIEEGMQLKEQMERENQELRRQLREVERGKKQGN